MNEKVKFSLAGRWDFHFGKAAIGLLVFTLLIPLAVIYLPNSYFYENSPLENTQLLILGATVAVCFFAKHDKNFYRFIAWLCVILFLREISCGRTIFFAKEGVENQFYSWKEIPYGYLAHPLFGLFIAGCVVYFFVSKAYKVLLRYLFNARILVWTWVFLALGMILGDVGEKVHMDSFEEMSESLFYLAFGCLVYFHAMHEENNSPKKTEE